MKAKVFLFWCVLSASVIEAALPANSGFGGAPLGGVIFPNVGGLADEFTALGLVTPGSAGTFGGTCRFSFGRGFQAGYYGAGGGFYTGNVFPNDVVKECDVTFGMHHAVAAYKFYLPANLAFSISAGGGVFQLTYTKTISNQPYRFGNAPIPDAFTYIATLKGITWSAETSGAIQYRFNAWFALGIEAGYLWAEVGDGELEQAGVPMSAAPGVDISGPFVRFGPMFNY